MNILKMEGICKAFNGVPVLDHVFLSIDQGEIHTILGENGAGKSTLMNILTGVLPLDQGRITFLGQTLIQPTVPMTEKLGIAFVHQELNLFPHMKVYENLFLRREITHPLGMLNKREMIRRSQALFQEMGVDIDPKALVADLKTGQKQLLEIARALLFDAKLLILDEPTTALNNEEIDRLFMLLRRLRDAGKSFIFISHKMPEIFAISDHYTVLRNGRFIARGAISETNGEALARLMVGESYVSGDLYQPRPLGPEVLRVSRLTGAGFTDVSFSVRRGEILALTGLQGSGSSEVMQALFGALIPEAGEVAVNGRALPSFGIHAAMQARISMLPSNRKENSVFPDLTILENTTIAEHTLSARRQHISRRKEQQTYGEMRELLNIKAPNPTGAVTALSGGNQQKVFLARWLCTQGEILLLDNPTQGIDVGSKAEIYRLILKLAESGKTILINTLEIGEMQKVADRCAVFYDGRLMQILSHDQIDEHTVMMVSTNAAMEA